MTCKEYELQSPLLSKIIIKCSTISGNVLFKVKVCRPSVLCLPYFEKFTILIISNMRIWFHRRSLSAFQDSWFKSLFVRKVDPRKDAHSHLLAKKEDNNLYKIQCVWDPCVVILYFIVTFISLYKYINCLCRSCLFIYFLQFTMSSLSALMITMKFGELLF